MTLSKYAMAIITILFFSGFSALAVSHASVSISISLPFSGAIEGAATVIAYDDFEESTLNVESSGIVPYWWMYNGPGYIGTMARTTLDAYSGTASLNITSPAAPWHKTETDLREIPIPNNLNVGLEFKLKILNMTGFGSVDFFLVYFNGTVEREAGFSLINYYDDGNLYITNLQPNNGSVSYVSSGQFFHVDTNLWYDVKAVANLNQSTYTSVQVNNITVDLKGTPINIFPHSEPAEFWVAVACMPKVYENSTILIDDLLVTSESL